MKLQYDTAGDPALPTIVFGSSLGADGMMWGPQTEALAQEFHVVTFAARGHGRSDVSPTTPTIDDFADDVVELVDDLGVDTFAYCGLSIGGAFGQSLGARYGHRLSALILSSTGMTIMTAAGMLARAESVLAEGMEKTADLFAERWFAPSFVESHPETVRHHLSHMRSMKPQGFADGCLALASFDGHASAKAISVPALVIAGALDEATPLASGRELAETIPHARLEVFEDASHLCNVERPDDFSKLVRDHVLLSVER